MGRRLASRGPLVSSTNNTVNEVVREKLGADGWLGGLVLRKASIGLRETHNVTPHEVNCVFGAVYNRIVQKMDRSRALDVVFEDRDNPSRGIAFPVPDQFLNSKAGMVNGTASDNLAVDGGLLIDDSRRRKPQSVVWPFQADIRWEPTLALQQRPHSVEAWAFDQAGNFGSASVSFTVDWSAPCIRIASPPDRYLTKRSLLTISGHMESGCRVLLGGYEVKTERDAFSCTVMLGNGENLVTTIVLDEAGNANTTFVRVLMENGPPAVGILSPRAGRHTRARGPVLRGTTDPFAKVSAWDRSTVAGPDGSFSLNLAP